MNIALAGEHIFQVLKYTSEYYHNTYEYWAGEYTPSSSLIVDFGFINQLSGNTAIQKLSLESM